MATEPTIDVLLNRFHGEIQAAFYPFFVLSMIERNGPSSKQEIREEVFKLTRGMLEQKPASHDRLVGRLEKTFKLIERTTGGSGADVQYDLTVKGRKLYDQTLEQIINPLSDALPAA